MAAPFVRDDVAAFLAYLNALPGPRVWEVSAHEARDLTHATRDAADVPTGPIAVVRDIDMSGPGGDRLALRLFDARPSRAPGGPVMVFLHGGGWVLGDLYTYEPVCAAIARGLDMPVVAVDYRRAPEHPFPAAPEDCEAAARFVAGGGLGFAPSGLVLAGDSAGGNLAIVTALALRDEPAAIPVLAHWAIYPATDMTTPYPSFEEFGDGHFLTQDAMRWFDAAYRPDREDRRASPLHADLAGLPPALVTTASLDPIRDQGRAYAARLAEAGVPVVFREARGTIHGYLNLRRAIPSSEADLAGDLVALAALTAEAMERPQ